MEQELIRPALGTNMHDLQLTLLLHTLQCAAHWHRVKDSERWSRDWGLLALAAADRVELALGEHMDTLYRLMQPHAEAFQKACGIDEVMDETPTEMLQIV